MQKKGPKREIKSNEAGNAGKNRINPTHTKKYKRKTKIIDARGIDGTQERQIQEHAM